MKSLCLSIGRMWHPLSAWRRNVLVVLMPMIAIGTLIAQGGVARAESRIVDRRLEQETANAVRDGMKFAREKNHEQAVACYLGALKSCASMYGEDSMRTVYVRFLLGVSYFRLNDYENARRCLEQARPGMSADKQYAQPTAMLLSMLGTVHADAGEFGMSERMFRRGAELLVAISQGKSEKMLLTLMGLGGAQCELGMVEEAATTLQQATDLYNILGSKVAKRHLMLLQLAAMTRMVQGDYERALEAVDELVTLAKELNGAESMQVAEYLWGSAVINYELGRDTRAMKLLERSATIYRSSYGAHSIETLSPLISIADLALRTDDFDRADSVLQQCLEILRNAPSVEDLAAIHRLLALVDLQRGDSASAAEHLKASTLALADRKDDFPNEWSKVLLVQNALSVQSGEYRDARRYCWDSVAICESRGLGRSRLPDALLALGEAQLLAGAYSHAQHTLNRAAEASLAGDRTSSDIQLVLARLAICQHEYQTAEELLQHVEKSYREKPTANHANVSRALVELATLHVSTLQAEVAERECLEALEISRKSYGEQHFRTARILATLGKALAIKKDYAGAQEHLSRALAILERSMGADHPETAETRMALALVLAELGEGERAVESANRALADHRDKLGEDHPQTKVAAESREEIECLASAAAPAMR